MGKQDKLRYDADFHRDVENTLLYIALCEKGELGCPDPMYFDGALICWESQIEKLMNISPEVRGNSGIDRAANSLPSIRGSVILNPELGARPNDRFQLIGAHQLSIQEKVKYFNLTGGQTAGGLTIKKDARIVEVRSVLINETGKGRQVHRGHIYQSRGSWWVTQEDRPIPGCRAGVTSVSFGIACMQTLAAQGTWQVRLRFAPKTASISLLTDPVGVRDVFRFRDVPEGKERRDALAHWVRDHWRQKRDDPDAEIYVREYLRGQRSFSWHGLNVEIAIPHSDIIRLEQGRERRKRMTLEQAMRKRKTSGRY